MILKFKDLMVLKDDEGFALTISNQSLGIYKSLKEGITQQLESENRTTPKTRQTLIELRDLYILHDGDFAKMVNSTTKPDQKPEEKNGA